MKFFFGWCDVKHTRRYTDIPYSSQYYPRMAFSSSFFTIPQDTSSQDEYTEPVLNMWHYMTQDVVDPSPYPLFEETLTSSSLTLVVDRPTFIVVPEVPLEACTLCTLFLFAFLFGVLCGLRPSERSPPSTPSMEEEKYDDDEEEEEEKKDETSLPPPEYASTMVKIHV